ncbi:hypothetical protein KIN20_015148 [Parelaphostrongylus tenuis]|uniref:Uncharacterized protein n=1 Tax=Parelaphostrongylus tenuis TaxID=148309 RepID=A0AAD5QPN7_PARTN|nr:hypothetical protein KIN20_015148 [Parelaphostrongylus tenuis]
MIGNAFLLKSMSAEDVSFTSETSTSTLQTKPLSSTVSNDGIDTAIAEITAATRSQHGRTSSVSPKVATHTVNPQVSPIVTNFQSKEQTSVRGKTTTGEKIGQTIKSLPTVNTANLDATSRENTRVTTESG